MWTLIKSLLTNWALLKVLLRTLGKLSWLLPIAFILKAIGIPMLILLLVLALPIFILLALIGLPFVLVLVFGGLLIAGFMALLAFGFTVLKIALPIILIVWVVRWLFRDRGTNGGATPATE
jgi:hypothetical protein